MLLYLDYNLSHVLARIQILACGTRLTEWKNAVDERREGDLVFLKERVEADKIFLASNLDAPIVRALSQYS